MSLSSRGRIQHFFFVQLIFATVFLLRVIHKQQVKLSTILKGPHKTFPGLSWPFLRGCFCKEPFYKMVLCQTVRAPDQILNKYWWYVMSMECWEEEGVGKCRPLSCMSKLWGVMRGSHICRLEEGWLKIIQITDLRVTFLLIPPRSMFTTSPISTTAWPYSLGKNKM